MTVQKTAEIFTEEILNTLLPKEKSDEFFEALYGDASEGAYDIRLQFAGSKGNEVFFELHLEQRPDKCLVCSLTYGLPEVFSRHPLINLAGTAQEIGKLLGHDNVDWQLGSTQSTSSELHKIPFTISLK